MLLDALYGEADKFARWIEAVARRRLLRQRLFDLDPRPRTPRCARGLQRDGVAVENGLPDGLRPGVVAFVDSGDVNHDDFVNAAWTSDPLSAVLSRVER